jgi:hypothetical protein
VSAYALGVALFLGLLVVFIVLEGKRQERVYGRTRGASLSQAGLLELQKHLQPDRKVEVMLERREEVEEDDAGDRPLAGRADGSPEVARRPRRP